jgi:hypothetical protein
LRNVIHALSSGIHLKLLGAAVVEIQRAENGSIVIYALLQRR